MRNAASLFLAACLVLLVAPASAQNSDPFGGGSGGDPFASKPKADPFGGKPSADPFGGKPSSDPFGGKRCEASEFDGIGRRGRDELIDRRRLVLGRGDGVGKEAADHEGHGELGDGAKSHARDSSREGVVGKGSSGGEVGHEQSGRIRVGGGHS